MQIKRLLLMALSAVALQSTARDKIDLSPLAWDITLDPQAQWANDKLFTPPVTMASLPVNLPTGGWQLLDHPQKTGVHLPATVEGEMWGWNGQTYGVTGNYVGVSWFRTQVDVPANWQGKRIALQFDAVRFRAEIFVNRQLVGYDLINSTPFEVDITPYAKVGQKNEVAVRITDPNGNFNWKDSQCYAWGAYLTNPSHGFGGITGRVHLVATDNTFIRDMFVENTPAASTVKVHIAAEGVKQATPLKLELRERGSNKVVWSRQEQMDGSEKTLTLSLPQAKLWSVEEPNLYELTAKLGNDELTQRFGFRWFEVRDVKGDRQFYLNGKRITLITAISWSFWPDNGITPSRELAYKQVRDAKQLGMNMLNFHRNIGNTDVLNAADELGLLYFEEPGGNQYPANKFDDGTAYTQFYFNYRNEKLARMIRRDRSHPSLVIYNLHNERGASPQAEDRRQMQMAHRLDPSRILTYNSCNGKNPEGLPDDHFKLHLMPGDTTFHNIGWWDNHHAGGPGVYHDYIYKGKDDYLRFSDNKGEIVYWGEEGAIGTPPRLQLIRDEILRSGRTNNWEAADYLAWYDAYDNFLRTRGFSKAFPCVDSLTRQMGNVAYYYQGRVMENVHISNTVDAYAINGWEAMKLENHSGVVDNYRNLKGDAQLIARYNRPLYLSVKLTHKVLAVGDTTTTDVYIVNRKDIHGPAMLQLTARDAQGKVLSQMKKRVKVSGGVVYGENLMTGWKVRIPCAGYVSIEAQLQQHGRTVATGDDKIYAVAMNATGIDGVCAVADTTGVLAAYLDAQGVKTVNYHHGRPQADLMIVGAFEPTQFGSGYSDILEWVYSGHTLVIVDNPTRWADLLCDKEVMDYRGEKALGRSWYGGNFFCRSHPIFEGLPTDCVFNWEYQCFAAYNRRRIGLRDMSGEVLVGCVSDHRKEVYSALSEIPAGRGRILITTLDIPACLKGTEAYTKKVDLDGMNESMNTFNTQGMNKADAVGRQLLLNMLRYASQHKQ